MAYRDDTIRTDSQGLARQALLDAAKKMVEPQPTDIAARLVPGAPLPTYPTRYER